MDAVVIIHCAATWALFGLIWTVQLDLYPLFGRVGRESFPKYHAEHMKRITAVVAPLMFVELATAGWLIFGAGEENLYLLASVPFLVANWISTAVLQVPLHKRLERGGFDAATCRLLTRSNWIRTLGWTLRAGLVGLYLR